MQNSKEFGLLMQSRRQAMEMSLNALASRMGGSPGASFLSKIEAGRVVPTREVADKLADALSVPREIMLNATGHAHDEQEERALEAFRGLIYEQPPVMASVPVMTIEGEPSGTVRHRLLRRREEARIVDLTDAANAPFIGEVIYSLDREPVAGTGVVAHSGGRLGAYKWHGGGTRGPFLEDASGHKPRAFRIEGVIIRVTTEIDLS